MYRKQMISGLMNLTWLDGREVKDDEKRLVTAWK